MFENIGFPELMLIMLVIVIFFGPKKIPEFAKSLGKGIAEFKRAMRDVQTELTKPENTPPEKPADPPHCNAEIKEGILLQKGNPRVNVKEPFDSYGAGLMAAGGSCEARIREYFSVISSRRSLNAFLSVFEEEALEQARAIDKNQRREGWAACRNGRRREGCSFHEGKEDDVRIQNS